MITYGQAKNILAKYAGSAGKCPTDDSVDLFVKQVLQYLLLQGTYGNERKFCFNAVHGCVTLPRELEVPLKVRFDGVVGNVWNRWFEFHSGNDWIEDNNCIPMHNVFEDPNRYPTVYDVGASGAYPGVLGTCEEADDAHVIVKGLDMTGREIVTYHRGQQISGVYLTIEKNKVRKSDVLFGKITEVYKTKTKGYVTLLGLDSSGCSRKYLSDYEPNEETPSYRRVNIKYPNCPPVCKISMLGRIRLKDYYADNDLIPFDNLYLLQVAGHAVNSMHNDDVERAITKSAYVEKLIETEGNYKKVNNGQPIEVFNPTSGGSIAVGPLAYGRKLIRRYGYGWWT